MMKFTIIRPLVLAAAVLMLAACSNTPMRDGAADEQEVLTIYPDGSMSLMGRPVPAQDVVIYPDGFGGEKAAVVVRIEPLHPNFYRDTIIVRRVADAFDPKNGSLAEN